MARPHSSAVSLIQEARDNALAWGSPSSFVVRTTRKLFESGPCILVSALVLCVLDVVESGDETKVLLNGQVIEEPRIVGTNASSRFAGMGSSSRLWPATWTVP